MTPPDTLAKALKTAERYTDRNPSEAKKESGNYDKGKFNWHGETIAVENPKGSTRSGTDKGGKRWEVKLPATYGYLRGTKAVDGDHVDCYVGDDHASKKVWVIDQVDAATGKYDEPKCMLSFPSKEAALGAYEKAFSDGRAKDRIGSVTEMSIPEFRAWANSSAAKKPLGKGYASGGAVPMPSKSNAKGDQSIAAALSTARRYARKNGGRAGYAWGGAPMWGNGQQQLPWMQNQGQAATGANVGTPPWMPQAQAPQGPAGWGAGGPGANPWGAAGYGLQQLFSHFNAPQGPQMAAPQGAPPPLSAPQGQMTGTTTQSLTGGLGTPAGGVAPPPPPPPNPAPPSQPLMQSQSGFGVPPSMMPPPQISTAASQSPPMPSDLPQRQPGRFWQPGKSGGMAEGGRIDEEGAIPSWLARLLQHFGDKGRAMSAMTPTDQAREAGLTALLAPMALPAGGAKPIMRDSAMASRLAKQYPLESAIVRPELGDAGTAAGLSKHSGRSMRLVEDILPGGRGPAAAEDFMAAPRAGGATERDMLSSERPYWSQRAPDNNNVPSIQGPMPRWFMSPRDVLGTSHKPFLTRSVREPQDGPANFNEPKAGGGGVGYEDGGMTPREVAPLPLPESRNPAGDWLSTFEKLKALHEDNPARPGDYNLGRGLANVLDVPAEMTGVPSVVRGLSAVHEGHPLEGGMEAALGAAPVLGPAYRGAKAVATAAKPLAVPAAITAAGLAGLSSSAGSGEPAAEKVDPVADLRASLKNLQQQRDDQKKTFDDAKARMEANRPKNRAPDEKRDLKFFDAKREYDDTSKALDKLNDRIGQTETKVEAAIKNQQTVLSGESLKKQVGEKSALQSALPYIGPIVGGGLGYLGGMGMKGLTKYLDKAGVETANKLLPGTGKAKPINERVSRINDFYNKGGSGVPPFSEAGTAPWWKANQKGVAAPNDLYPARSRALDWTANAGLTGVYGGEAALGYKWGQDAHEEQKAAREAFAADKNEANVQRLLKAEHDAEVADFMLRMGLAGGLGQGVKGSIGIAGTPAPRPNVARAQAERADIRQALAAAKAKAQAKAEKAEGRGSSKKGSSPPRNPNGAAHLLPLGLLPPITSVGESEPSPLSSLASSPPEEPPYADGGEVKHHSNYQPRYKRGDQRGKFKAGGPIYPEPPKEPLTPKSGFGGAISRALDTARRFARGGKVTVGAIKGPTGGRADALPISVPAGAFVIPSDCVSGMPGAGGNTEAGMRELDKMFGKPKGRADGGTVPIKISHGEYVLDPDQVARIGGGDMDRGHQLLDDFVRRIRADHVRTLSSLPGPAR